MKKRIINIVLAGLLLSAISLCGCAEEEKPLRMALVPAGGALQEAERYEPIAAYLSEQIGRDIEVIVCTDYAAVITALKIGDCDFAKMGVFSYVLAVQEAQVEIIVKGVKKSTGKSTYQGLIITRADSGIKTLEDLKGKTFAYVDVASASGYLFPLATFKAAGINPEEDFEEIFFAGSHPGVVEAVYQGVVDAGATANHRLDDAIAAGVMTEDDIFILDDSQSMPMPPTVVKSGMDPVLKQKLQDAYLSMPADLLEQAVGNLSGYVLAYDSDFDSIREVAEVLGLDLGEMD